MEVIFAWTFPSRSFQRALDRRLTSPLVWEQRAKTPPLRRVRIGSEAFGKIGRGARVAAGQGRDVYPSGEMKRRGLRASGAVG